MTDGLHELPLPDEVAMLWRGLWLLAAFCAVGGALVFIQHAVPRSRPLLMIVVVIYCLRGIVVQLERFERVVYWEGLPVDTVIISLVLAGLFMWARDEGRLR